MIEILPFAKTYSGRKVVDFPGNVLEKGGVYAVIGANGSGKSTFAKIISGIITSDGKNRAVDKSVSTGYLPQKSYCFSMPVRKNILLNTKDENKADEMSLKLGLGGLLKSSARTLSGGEAAKTALARILVKKYDLLILDEPTDAMDMESTAEAEKLIVSYAKENNSAVIVITHSISQAERIGNYLFFFRNGLLAASGKCPDILSSCQNDELKEFISFA